MKKLYILLLLLPFSSNSLFGQVKIGDLGGLTQNSILDINNTGDLGLLLNTNSIIIDTSVSNPQGTMHYFGGNLFLSQNSSTAKWNAFSPWIFNGDTLKGVSYPVIGRSGVGIGVNTLDAGYNPVGTDNYPANLHVGMNSKNIDNSGTGAIKTSAIMLGDDKSVTGSATYPVMLIDNDEILVKANAGGTTGILKLQELANGKVQVGKSTSLTSKFNTSGKIKEQGGIVQPAKSIIMWDGTVVTDTNFNASGLGMGNMKGWAICNGTNGTPNLTGQFIRGSGERAREIRSSSGPKHLGWTETKVAGNPGGVAENIQTSKQIRDHDHLEGTLSIASDGAHTHAYGGSSTYLDSGTINDGAANGDGLSLTGNNYATNSAGAHSHSVTGTTAINSSTNAAMPNLPSYYVVIYLMKL